MLYFFYIIFNSFVSSKPEELCSKQSFRRMTFIFKYIYKYISKYNIFLYIFFYFNIILQLGQWLSDVIALFLHYFLLSLSLLCCYVLSFSLTSPYSHFSHPPAIIIFFLILYHAPKIQQQQFFSHYHYHPISFVPIIPVLKYENKQQ